MSYNNLPWKSRFHLLGDQAEGVFEELKPLGAAERVGFRRPSVPMTLMSDFLKHTPDYYTSTGWLVEVMGVGRDDTIKLKKTKYDALRKWHSLQDTVLFVWSSSRQTWLIAPIDALKRAVERSKRRDTVSAFENDGNVYYPIPYDELAEDKDVTRGE